MDYPANAIDKLIRKRRTIKPEDFGRGVIDDEEVESLLENATWAPTHGMTEPWRFVVFTGIGLSELGNFQAELYKLETPTSLFLKGKYEKLLSRPQLASHVIAVGMERQESEKIPFIEEVAATACAVQNILLSAAARNIAAYWGSGGMTYHEKMKGFIGLKSSGQCLGFVFLGTPPSKQTVSQRMPLEEKVRWIR